METTASTTADHMFGRESSQPGYQAYQILRVVTVAPIVAGAGKFLHLLVNWDQYLAHGIASLRDPGLDLGALALGRLAAGVEQNRRAQ